MPKRELWALWKQLFSQPAPPQLRRGLLLRILACRIQERAYGGLSRPNRRRLRQLARQLAAHPEAEISGVQRFKPGTRLVRDWHGHAHQVTIVESGYEYAGQRYPSLSAIARRITGTRWSGPLFFGLKGHLGRHKENAHPA